ncbi:MAG TPA: BMP family ABC transporter substrate-binding protein [Actinomycetota bacterium]
MGTTGGPERRRSGPLRAVGIAAAAAAIAAAAVVVLVQAGSSEPAPGPTSTLGRDTHVCVVVGTPGADGARLRVPLGQALWKAHRELQTTGSLVVVHGDRAMAAAIDRFVGRGCDLVATTGTEARAATFAAASAHPDRHFALIGGTSPASLPNVTVVRFHPEQAAFVAGYLAGGISRTGIVGAFGGIRTPEVVAMLQSFAAGVAKLNADRELAVPLLGWNPETQRGLFAGSVGDPEAGRRVARRLVSNGADVVFAVAGDAARGAASVVHGVGDSLMIGSGWDRARTASVPDLWVTSVEDRAAVMLRVLIGREIRGTFRPGLLEATLANGGVGLAQLRGPGASISGKLRYELEQLGIEIADGGLSIQPRSYPALPSPGATPSAPATEPGDEGDGD